MNNSRMWEESGISSDFLLIFPHVITQYHQFEMIQSQLPDWVKAGGALCLQYKCQQWVKSTECPVQSSHAECTRDITDSLHHPHPHRGACSSGRFMQSAWSRLLWIRWEFIVYWHGESVARCTWHHCWVWLWEHSSDSTQPEVWQRTDGAVLEHHAANIKGFAEFQPWKNRTTLTLSEQRENSSGHAEPEEFLAKNSRICSFIRWMYM